MYKWLVYSVSVLVLVDGTVGNVCTVVLRQRALMFKGEWDLTATFKEHTQVCVDGGHLVRPRN